MFCERFVVHRNQVEGGLTDKGGVMVAKVAALVLNRASIAVTGQLIHAGRHMMPKHAETGGQDFC